MSVILEEESEEEEEDYTTPILPVTNALDYIHALRQLISSFDNADGTLQNLNKVENFLHLEITKSSKQTKIYDSYNAK
jgi:hypothetical protein